MGKNPEYCNRKVSSRASQMHMERVSYVTFIMSWYIAMCPKFLDALQIHMERVLYVTFIMSWYIV
jgi:hypothetical protein